MRSPIHAHCIATQHVGLPLSLPEFDHRNRHRYDTAVDFVPRRSIRRYNRIRPARRAPNV